LNVPAVHTQPRGRNLTPRPNHLYRVSTIDERSGGERIGFIDKTGKLVIGFDRLPKTTVAVGDFHEGRAVIYLKKKEVAEEMDYNVGYIDETGKVIIASRFDVARNFSEGLAYVEAKSFRGFIDRRGKAVIKVGDLRTKDFHEGLAAVGRDEPGGEWGYIDRSGRLVIKRRYSFADDFSEGLAGVVFDDDKYGFINQRGETVIPPRFSPRRGVAHSMIVTDTSRFSEGLACVRETGGLYGYINRKGEFSIPPRFAFAQEFSEGLAWVVTKDSKVGWIDKTGRWVVTGINGRSFPAELGFIYTSETLNWRYSEGLVPFFLYAGGKYLRGYMDRSGQVSIQPRGDDEFGILNPFYGGVALVYYFVNGDLTTEQKYGYINTKGRFIWRSQ
jgi:hypothetical protein